MQYVDIVARYVPNYGFLPIVLVDGVEKYRGEFFPTAKLASDRAEKASYEFTGKKG